MSTSFAHGKQIVCPFCNNPGYIIKERPRKKHKTYTLREFYKTQKIPHYPLSIENHTSYTITYVQNNQYHYRNCRNYVHKDYVSTHRDRNEYFRIKHNYRAVNRYRKNRPGGCPPFCYIGSPNAIIRKLELEIDKIKFIFPKTETSEESYRHHQYHHRVTEWISGLKKQVKKILMKTVFSEDDIGFLAYLRSLVNHPTLGKDIVEWLKDVEQRELEKSKKLTIRDRENKDRRVKQRKKSRNRIDSDMTY